MKKTILFTVVLSAAFISGRLYAQDDKARTDVAATHSVDVNGTSAAASAGASGYHPAAVSSINVRAIKDFKWRYTKAADEQWSVLDRGVSVVFSKDSARTRVFYDDKGHWQASVTYCNEWKLPYFVRDMVRRANYDLPITSVNILEVPEHTVYLVHVEDAKFCRIIRVTEEGDMDVLSEFYKSN
jgi:hypothetical protein